MKSYAILIVLNIEARIILGCDHHYSMEVKWKKKVVFCVLYIELKKKKKPNWRSQIKIQIKSWGKETKDDNG